ncbi:MAG: hypothetical protein HYX80_01000 [Chloroflexi bacterium]|nr:hypothetical protein [Chloroflexota bacterium]
MGFKKEIRFFCSYIGNVFRTAWKSSFSVSQYLLSIVFLIVYLISKGIRFFKPNLSVSPLESIMEINWWQASLIALGVVALMRLSLAPYWMYRKVEKDRSEARASLLTKPKSVFLANKDTLLRTIAEAKLAAVDEAENIENIKLKKTGNVVFPDADTWDKLGRIQQRFDWACESFEREAFATNSVFEPILKPLLTHIRYATEVSPPTVIDYKTKLEEMVAITRNKIEELTQPIPDKED